MRGYYIFTSGNRRDELGMLIPGDPVDWMNNLLDAGIWGGNDDTPSFMNLKKGDRVIVQSADTGFVATATVKGGPRRTRKTILRDRSCTHEVGLTVRRFRTSVPRTAALRRRISRANGDRPISATWANYFRTGIRPICKPVFDAIASR